MNWNKVTLTIKITLLLFLSTNCYSGQLFEKFNSINDSVFSNKMIFKCSGTVFKYEKETFGSIKLYSRNGLEWLQVDNLKIKSTGVEFDGLQKIGGKGKKFILRKVSLPTFNNKKTDILEYFEVNEDINPMLLHLTIDFYEGELTGTNINGISDNISFLTEKYRKEQKLRSYGTSIYGSSVCRDIFSDKKLTPDECIQKKVSGRDNFIKRNHNLKRNSPDLYENLLNVNNSVIKIAKEEKIKKIKNLVALGERDKKINAVVDKFTGVLNLTTNPFQYIYSESCF